MKKVLALAVIAIFLMVPAAFAKTAISDSDLGAVTASEGIVILFVDPVVVSSINVATQSFTDGDGFSLSGTDPYFGATIAGTYTGATFGALQTIDNLTLTITGALTIDVGWCASCTSLTGATNTYGNSAGINFNSGIGVAGVLIGLPTVTLSTFNVTQILAVNWDKDKTLGQEVGPGTAQLTIGTLYQGGISATLSLGKVLITTH